MGLGQVLIGIQLAFSNDQTIAGTFSWDRPNGGALKGPAGTSFPASPVGGEWFLRTDTMTLYQRNGDNTAWVAVGGGGAAPSTLHPGELTASVPFGESEIFGVVSGLPSAPTRVVGVHVLENTGMEQSGYSWTFNAYEMTADGFKWRIKMNEDDYWPDSAAPAGLQVYYLWSES